MITKHDKIKGMFLGTAIGDALGMPVESLTLETIRERHGRLTDYISAKGHKWFSDEPLGSWTDDTYLTLAVARALIEAKWFTMESQVKHHVKALESNCPGWGPSTKEAIKRLAKGVSYKESGIWKAPDENKKNARGVGNGICMKVAPLAAFFDAVQGMKPSIAPYQSIPTGLGGWSTLVRDLVDFTAMTHPTSIAVSSCFAQLNAVLHCLQTQPNEFNPKAFLFKVLGGCMAGESHFPETLTDKLASRMETLLQERTEEELLRDYNRGKAYVFDSLPFTYAYFLQDPQSVECIYNVASAGGDTDTNASMAGALLGALHGQKVFPDHLVDKLHNKEEVLSVASEFAQTFYPEG